MHDRFTIRTSATHSSKLIQSSKDNTSYYWHCNHNQTVFGCRLKFVMWCAVLCCAMFKINDISQFSLNFTLHVFLLKENNQSFNLSERPFNIKCSIFKPFTFKAYKCPLKVDFCDDMKKKYLANFVFIRNLKFELEKLSSKTKKNDRTFLSNC